jgi:hypothetical protein
VSRRALVVGNASGFYGDRFTAWREMIEGGALDVLTGDYLSELTMLILWKARRKDPGAGYAATFLAQMEDVLAPALDRDLRLVSNAGGLAPERLAAEVRALGARLGRIPRVATVHGDDVLALLPEWQSAGETLAHMDTGRPLADAGAVPLTANAYLGGWGIAAALDEGADVVVCGRVADASLVSGPAAAHFGWSRGDWDALAGAVAAGHILECGTQATGGNYAFFSEVPGLEHPGFPVAEIHEDGSCIVTKHAGAGGAVSTGTVTAQLLYEIGGPRYVHPDVVVRFDTLRVESVGPDRVRVWGARGEPAPRTAKLSIATASDFRNAVTFVLTGLDIDAKARLVEATLRRGAAARCAHLETRLVRAGETAYLTVSVRDPEPRPVGRAFSAACVELALASVPGLYLTAPPAGESACASFWPALVDAARVPHRVTLPDGSTVDVAPPPIQDRPSPPEAPDSLVPPPDGPTRRLPLGTAFGARSGDKGGNANVGVWARSLEAWAWLDATLTVELFQELLPETAAFAVQRHRLPNLWALNFVVVGLLGEGAGASSRADPQAKALGESLRAGLVDLPVSLA